MLVHAPHHMDLDLLRLDETDAALDVGSRRRIRRWILRGVLGFIAFLLIGNLGILAASLTARTQALPQPDVQVKNFRVVDEHVWRGAAPGEVTYRDLAAAGATTVVDLRAEDNVHVDEALLSDLGLTRIHLPIRDGQIPSQDQIDRFVRIVAGSEGPVFVHCGAGVGRTGAMVAAYLVRTSETSGIEAVRRNLSVGPPSLEQIAFAATLDGANADRVPTTVVVVSRVLDAPRRLWSRYGV